MKRKFKVSAIGRKDNADSNSNGSGWFLNVHFGHVHCFFCLNYHQRLTPMKKNCQLTVFSASAEKTFIVLTFRHG